MNKIMQIISDAEKVKVDLESTKTIIQKIKLISEQAVNDKISSGIFNSILKLISASPEVELPNVYIEIATTLDSFLGGLAGKKLLDVGCDYSGHLIKTISATYKAAESVGVNPALENVSFSNTCRIMRQDIRATTFPDNYFDCIVSISAFEHIQELQQAFNEMFRILKPGGILFSRFGPIWSSSFGHHMWFTHKGVVYNYWNTFLPPFCHLLMAPKELFDFCTPLYGEEAALKIVEYIFFTQEQNRLLFSDYRELVAQSSFRTLFFTGYTSAVLSRLYTPVSWPHTLAELHAKYPRNDNFKYDGIELLLKKPQTPH